jgi:hypothetical protein
MDLPSIQLVCKRWKNITSSERFWEIFHEKNWQDTEFMPITKINQFDGNDLALQQEIIPLYNQQVNNSLASIRENIDGFQCQPNACVSQIIIIPLTSEGILDQL